MNLLLLITMSKKIRKKKEVENDKYDIIQLDEKIKKIIIEEGENIEDYKNRIVSIKNILKKTTSYRKKKELNNELLKLTTKISELENNDPFTEYICITQKIIDEYMKLLTIPVNISFFKKNNENSEIEEKKECLLDQFLNIAKKYISIKTFKRETVRKVSCECGNNNDFTHTENTITCEICGMEINIYTIQTNFKDIDRVNLNQKYKYSKRVYFRDTVNRYEGKQNKKIEKDVYDDLEQWFVKHNLLTENENFHKKHSRITKEHIYMSLSETGHNLHYEDINLIHYQFTGVSCPDISNIRTELFEDFDKVMTIYDSLQTDRINSLNSQYILYQLLRRRKIKVNESYFGMLKTRDRLIDYDEIYKQICLKLEWTFIPTV